MGQFTLNGRIYEEMPGGKARVIGIAPAATPATPGSLAGGGTFIPAPPKAPEGFRYSNGGRTLEAIPGGPADKPTKPPTPPEGYRWSSDGSRLEVIPGGPKDPAAAGDAPMIGDTTKEGKAYFDSLPDSYKGTVRQLLGNRLVLSSFAMAKPYYQQAINAATKIDPTYDPSLAQPRATALKEFTGTGKGAVAVGAVNRLAANLQELKSISDKLGGPNVGFAPANKLIAGTEQSFMPALAARYDALVPEIATQFDLVMKGAKGSGATVSGIADAKGGLDRARSQEERNGAMQEIARAVHGAIEPIKEQWDSAYGGSRAPPMWVSKNAGDFFSSIDPEHADTYGGNDWRGLPGLKGDKVLPWEMTPFTPPTDPPGGAGGTGGNTPPTIRPGGLGGVPTADYSGMTGGPSAGLAGTNQKSMAGALAPTSRTVFDPVGAATLSAFIKKGAPYDTAAAYAQSHGFNPPDPKDYAAAVTFAANHGGATNVEADRNVPTTLGERLASSLLAAGIAGATSGGTAGFADTLGRTLAGPGWDANRAALAATNPTADLAGNVAGGVFGAVAAPELAGRFLPGNLAGRVASLAESNPLAARLISNGGYGGAYGANENPDNPVKGGLLGAITGAVAGEAGQKATGGLANIIAPPEGAFGPAYAQGVFPTVGQRFGQSGVVGRAVNTAEQAMQSFPGLGAMVARARDIPRDAAQIGAFNNALGDLAPFAAAGHDVPNALPPGTAPGTAPHAFTADAFNKAYPIARSGMQLVPTKDMVDQATAFADKWRPLLNTEQQGQLQNLIKGSVVSRIKNGGGALDGQAYQQAASDIGGAAQAWSKSEPLLSQAASEYGGIIDNAARASSDPQAVALLDAADKGYAKYAGVIRPASARGGGDPGEFTMKAFDRSVQNNAAGPNGSQYLRGTALMQPYADAIRPLGDVLANSGTGERLMTNRLFMGEQGAAGAGALATGLGGAALAHPGALAPFLPYAPGANALFTRAIAPRQYTLPPAFADALNLAGAKVNDFAPLIGKAAVPGALAYRGLAQ